MKTTTPTTLLSTNFIALLFALSLITIACNKTKNDPVTTPIITTPGFTITVGAFSENNGVYTALGNELIFDSSEECQTWTRTAQSDAHNSATHSHYNAAANISYNHTDTIFSWTEFGPELDQSAIDATCSAGVNGKNKTVNTTSYYQDKPNVYLKITRVD
ncbi:MAG: hypothetical protein JKY03_02165 [Aureispira sp.]|nr:hypothetical protein [Aureispira sp.]